MAEFILEDGKLVIDGIPSARIPSDINLRTVNRLKVATIVNCKNVVRQRNDTVKGPWGDQARLRRTKHGFHNLRSKPLVNSKKAKGSRYIEYLRRRNGGSKVRRILFEGENSIQSIAAAKVCSSTKERKRQGPVEHRDCLWWQHGYHNWTNEQFKRRLRVNRDTFDFILNAIEDLITKEITKLKELVSPDRQLGLTLYRLAHGMFLFNSR